MKNILPFLLMTVFVHASGAAHARGWQGPNFWSIERYGEHRGPFERDFMWIEFDAISISSSNPNYQGELDLHIRCDEGVTRATIRAENEGQNEWAEPPAYYDFSYRFSSRGSYTYSRMTTRGSRELWIEPGIEIISRFIETGYLEIIAGTNFGNVTVSYRMNSQALEPMTILRQYCEW